MGGGMGMGGGYNNGGYNQGYGGSPAPYRPGPGYNNYGQGGQMGYGQRQGGVGAE